MPDTLPSSSDGSGDWPAFTASRDAAVVLARAALFHDVEELERAVEQGELALRGSLETFTERHNRALEREIGLVRALLAFRRAVEALRPAEAS